jgi:hypothetical protein
MIEKGAKANEAITIAMTASKKGYCPARIANIDTKKLHVEQANNNDR